MQCLNTYWASTVHLPLCKASISDAKFSITQTRNQPLNGLHGDPDGDDDIESSEITLPLPSHVKSITSTSNPFVKHCLKLRQSSSYRYSHGSALVVGTTPIREIYRFRESIQERPTMIDCLLLLEKAEIPEGLHDLRVRLLRVSAAVMKKLAGMESSDSIEAIALLKIPSSFCNLVDNRKDNCRSWFPSPRRIIVLDGIQDPGNLGTLIRSAMAFRWGGVFLLPGCCDPFNNKALRASRGASFQIPIVSGTWNDLEALRNEFQMKMLAGHPDNDKESKPVARLCQELVDSLADKTVCLVLGSEGRGISGKAKHACELVSIPMAGEFESLNVSVAGGIFLYMLQPENHTVT